jgi:hypothetical protein
MPLAEQKPLGDSSTAERQVLALLILVRIQVPQLTGSHAPDDWRKSFRQFLLVATLNNFPKKRTNVLKLAMHFLRHIQLQPS